MISPIDALAASLHHAAIKGLPDIEFRDYSWRDKQEGRDPESCPLKNRRPQISEIEIVMFCQTWGSTALGFGGIGGSAMTPAYTVIAICEKAAAVYFGGRHAYTVSDAHDPTFRSDMKRSWMVEVATAKLRYSNTLP